MKTTLFCIMPLILCIGRSGIVLSAAPQMDFGSIDCNVSPYETNCDVPKICRACCKQPCYTKEIWGSGSYTYDSPICQSAVHDLRISMWNSTQNCVVLQRQNYNSWFLGSVRFNFNSIEHERNKNPSGNYVFISPRITEEILDVASLHYNYLFGQDESHKQMCLLVPGESGRQIQMEPYTNRLHVEIFHANNQMTCNHSDIINCTFVWLGALSETSSGGYQCVPTKSMLSIPTSIAMRKDGHFLPECLTVTASINETVTLSMKENSRNRWVTEWRKDSMKLNESIKTVGKSDGRRLKIERLSVGSSGIYSLQYKEPRRALSFNRGITRLIVRVCPAEYYGDGCTSVCPVCQNGGVCHDITGDCICAPGFNGSLCENACEAGYFGKSCSMTCPEKPDVPKSLHCMGYAICLPDPYGCSCAAGFKRLSCDESCESGEYGAGCTQRRNCHCSANNSCDIYSGRCPDGCEYGWYGDACTISYPVLKEPPVIVNVTESSVLLEFLAWSPRSNEETIKPISYFILYRAVNDSVWSYSSDILAANETQYVYLLKHLKPDTTYSVGVAAVAPSGVIQFIGIETVITTTNCGRSQRPPTNITLSATSDRVTVSWQYPPQDTWNCRSVKSVLYISSAEHEEPQKEFDSSVVNYTFASDPYTEWHVVVCLVGGSGNAKGETCSGEEVITTDEKAPGAVVDLDGVSGPRKMLFSWKVPTVKNGIIRFYEISYRRLGWTHGCTIREDTPDEILVNTTFTRYTLKNLLPSSNYSIKVSGYTVAKGQQSEISMTTEEDVPSGCPYDVRIRGKTLEWHVPHCNTTNGNIKSYVGEISGQDPWDVSVVRFNTYNTSSQFPEYPTPFTTYLVNIKAENRAGVGKQNCTFSIRTRPDAPPEVEDATIFSRSSDKLFLTWRPPDPPHGELSHYHINGSLGNILFSYFHKYVNASDAKCDEGFALPRINHCYVATGLKKDKNYFFQIEAFNKGVEKGGKVVVVDDYTIESVPFSPRYLTFSERSDTGIKLFWSAPVYLTGNITHYSINVTTVESPRDALDFSLRRSGNSYVLSNLTSASTYNVCIAAENRVGYGPAVCEVFNTSITAPKISREPKLMKATDKEIIIKIFPGNGTVLPISAYFVVVDPVRKKDSRRKRYSEAHLFRPRKCDDLTGTLDTMYVAVKLENVSQEGEIVSLGSGSCQNGYYNAYLETGASYKVGVAGQSVFHGEVEYSDITFITSPITASSPELVETTTRGVLAFLIVVLMVVASVLIYHFFGKPDCCSVSRKASPSLNVKFVPRTQEIFFGLINAGLEDELTDLTSVNVDDLENRIVVTDLQIYVRNSLFNHSIQKEFLVIPRGELYQCDNARIPANKSKNRYGNMLPYDRSRVILDEQPGDEHSDYINANYIDGYQRPKKYIATQGPKSSTIVDFWRMVWMENTCKIIMATNLIEGTRKKCEQYWPDETSESSCSFGDFTLTLLQLESSLDFDIRTLALQKGDTVREVKQFHYHSWPDHGVPMYTMPTIIFLKKVREYQVELNHPIVVHCSAGIGRTGTLILLDAMLDMGEAEGSVDLVCHLARMRLQRSNIVENIDQYIYTYNCLVDAFSNLKTYIPCEEIVSRVKGMQGIDPLTDMSSSEEEFEMLFEQLPLVSHSEAAVGYFTENENKNRNPQIIPLNRARHILQHAEDSDSNYINAVYINGYRQKDAFLVTQVPLPNTVNDFWCMVHEKKSKTIVLLNEVDFTDETCPEYWPTKPGDMLAFGRFRVFCQSSGHEESVLMWNLLLYCESIPPNEPLPIVFMQLLRWEVKDVIPRCMDGIINLFERVTSRQDQAGKHVITVQCFDGASACGVFCAVMFSCEMVKKEHHVDVYRSVRYIRMNRKEFILNVAQYEFLYHVAAAYLERLPTDANLAEPAVLASDEVENCSEIVH